MQACGGHRPGLDALVLAASVPAPADVSTVLRLADFGSGSGAAGLCVRARVGADVTLIERDPVAIADAGATLRHPANAVHAARATLLRADLMARGDERIALGLVPNAFDHVIANPPFNPADAQRASPDRRRAEAHVMDADLLDGWTRTAAATLAPRGTLTMIVRPESLPAVIEVFARRFSGPHILPLLTKPGPATRLLVRGRLGSREPLAVYPSLALRRDGEPTPELRAIERGEGLDFS